MKNRMNIDVNCAARKRIRILFDNFENFYVSFSGGKDSGVLLNLVIEEARERGRLPVDVLIIDMEAQYLHTVNFISSMVQREEINTFWVCLPISLRNAASQFQPKWVCWDPDKKKKWLRPIPEHNSVISEEKYFPFFTFGMEFEEFVTQFGEWYSKFKGTRCACLVGIRADESLNRYRTVKNNYKRRFKEYLWTTYLGNNIYNAYPIYDWSVKDIWTANGRFDWNYNHIYDLMDKAGLSLSQQRLCQPFGDDQKKGLWLYQILEPHTWQKLVERVEGCNFGARYSKEQGKIMGYYKFDLPEGYSYRAYSKHLLNSMPPPLAEHYRKRIFKFLNWWRNNAKKQGVYKIPDYADKKLEASKKVPSWRRICKVLIKNDYWCRGLSFGQNKTLTNNYFKLYEGYLLARNKE